MEPQGFFSRQKTMTEFQNQPKETNRSHDGDGSADNHMMLASPANLIASLPGALGYYPNEAVALIHFRANPDDVDCIEVGQYQASDLGSPAAIREMVEDMPMYRRVSTVAVVVTRIPESSMAQAAVELLHDARDDFGPLIDTCWMVSEVAEGTPYVRVFGPDLHEEPGPLDDVVASGTVSSVLHSPTMRPLIENGLLPELDREDTFRHFDPVSLPDMHVCSEISPAAYRRGEELLELFEVAPYLARPEVEKACDLFSAAPSVSLIDSEGSLLIDETFAHVDDIELLAAHLSRARLRDCLIVDAMASPRGAAALLLTVARNFTGTIRANALCLWAMVALSLRVYPWASAALVCALEEVPGHNLAKLLTALMQVGRVEELLDATTAGCRDTWFDLGG